MLGFLIFGIVSIFAVDGKLYAFATSSGLVAVFCLIGEVRDKIIKEIKKIKQ